MSAEISKADINGLVLRITRFAEAHRVKNVVTHLACVRRLKLAMATTGEYRRMYVEQALVYFQFVKAAAQEKSARKSVSGVKS